jgi:hypothetical protein
MMTDFNFIFHDNREFMRFDFLTEVKMSVVVFWVVTLFGFVDWYKRFGGTYCFHLQSWYSCTIPHGVTTQKTSMNEEGLYEALNNYQ